MVLKQYIVDMNTAVRDHNVTIKTMDLAIHLSTKPSTHLFTYYLFTHVITHTSNHSHTHSFTHSSACPPTYSRTQNLLTQAMLHRLLNHITIYL